MAFKDDSVLSRKAPRLDILWRLLLALGQIEKVSKLWLNRESKEDHLPGISSGGEVINYYRKFYP
jgi:hypothetical protein